MRRLVRLSLDLSAGLNAELEGLADEIGCSKSELLRRALALISVAIEAKRRGESVGLFGPDGQLITRVVGL